jgi:hypothetical protein
MDATFLERVRSFLFRKQMVFALLGVAILGEVVFLTSSNLKTGKFESLDAAAAFVLGVCQQEDVRRSCYDREIPRLMDSISMENAFRVTTLVQSKDPSYRFCHVLGHNLSAREVQKDPSKWKEIVSRCPSGVCSNGCLHGGFQERFRKESLSAEEVQRLTGDLKTLCEKRTEWNPTGLEQASCYHALGHLTMYVTTADINKSAELCPILSRKEDGRDFTKLCLDGAFMQIFQPLEPEDVALIEGKEVKREQLDRFCSSFSGLEKSVCRTEGWPLYFEELRRPEGLVDFCNRVEKKYRSGCYNDLIYVMVAQMNFDVEKIIPYCAGMPKENRGRCFAHGASRFIESDYANANEAAVLCSAAEKHDAGDICFSELLSYSKFNYHHNSDGFKRLCDSLPALWKTKCLE